MKKLKLIMLFVLLFASNSSHAWNGETHIGITNQAEKNKFLDAYLINVGLPKGEKTPLPLTYSNLPDDFRTRIYFTPAFDPPLGLDPITKQALIWMQYASEMEDVPLTRAGDHFHDPTNDQGWDENMVCYTQKGGKWFLAIGNEIVKSKRPLEEFVCYGKSARDRAFDNDPYMELNWKRLRDYQYEALTNEFKYIRDHQWAGGPHGFSLKNCVGDEVTGSMGLKR